MVISAYFPAALLRLAPINCLVSFCFSLSTQIRFYQLMVEYDTHEKATFDLCQVGPVAGGGRVGSYPGWHI